MEMGLKKGQYNEDEKDKLQHSLAVSSLFSSLIHSNFFENEIFLTKYILYSPFLELSRYC